MGNFIVKFDVGGTVYRTTSTTIHESKYLSDLIEENKSGNRSGSRSGNQPGNWSVDTLGNAIGNVFSGCSGPPPKKNPKSFFSEDSSKEKEFFIDRDGFLFRYILLYLRTGELDIDKQHWKSLRTEADFYQIPKLVLMINILISKEQPKETVYKLLDEQEFRRFSNIDINSTGNITSCTAVGSGKNFIMSIQCDTIPNDCPRGIQAPHLCEVTCDKEKHYIYENLSSKKTIKYLVSITE